MKWHKGKVVDMNLKENQDAWRQRLFVSTAPYSHSTYMPRLYDLMVINSIVQLVLSSHFYFILITAANPSSMFRKKTATQLC